MTAILCAFLIGLALIEAHRRLELANVRALQGILDVPKVPEIVSEVIPNPMGWTDNPPNLRRNT
jgi:hypothetical protein